VFVESCPFDAGTHHLGLAHEAYDRVLSAPAFALTSARHQQDFRRVSHRRCVQQRVSPSFVLKFDPRRHDQRRESEQSMIAASVMAEVPNVLHVAPALSARAPLEIVVGSGVQVAVVVGGQRHVGALGDQVSAVASPDSAGTTALLQPT
jgi:hypothetical protein